MLTVVLVLVSLLALAALVVNVWATIRVLRFPFSTGQRIAQVVLIWCVPGFCLLSLLTTRAEPEHEFFYKDREPDASPNYSGTSGIHG